MRATFLLLLLAASSALAQPVSGSGDRCYGKACKVSSLAVTPGGVVCVGYDGTWSYGFRAQAGATSHCRFNNATCSGACDVLQNEQVAAGNMIRTYGIIQAPIIAATNYVSATNYLSSGYRLDVGGTAVNSAGMGSPTATPHNLISNTSDARAWWTQGDLWRDLQSGAHPTLDRRTYSLLSALEHNAALSWYPTAPLVSGLAATVTTTDAAVAATASYGGYSFRQMQTTATTGSASKVTSSGPFTGATYGPRVCSRVRLNATSGNRAWVGLGSADPSGSDAGSGSFIGFRYVAAGAGKWEGVACNAGTCTTASIGSAYTIASPVVLCADLREGTAATLWVDGSPSRFTTNLPPAGTLLAPWATITNTATSVVAMGVESITVETR